jgi:hypothetical protein
MSRLMADFAAGRAGDVIRRGGETFLDAAAVPDLLDQAEQRSVKVLGLEGFLISGQHVYPALSRIADFSADTVPASISRARALLAGPWASPPTATHHHQPRQTRCIRTRQAAT